MQTPWDHRFAQRMQRMGSSAIRDLLRLTEHAEIISFGGGMPAPDLFPLEEFRRACDVVLTDFGPPSMQYGTTEGYRPLRELIAADSKRLGIEVTLDNIQITSGSQQALDLLGKVLINPGDRILVESPTYLGALQAWSSYGAEYVAVPMDEYGMITDQLEKALRSSPKFIYVLPNFQNPTGTVLAMERRQKLVELADRYGVPIVEDDPYGQLRYEGDHLPTVACIDNQYRGRDGQCYDGNVIYLSTFSKTLSPGLRLAWVVAPPVMIRKLEMAKEGADLNTSTFIQYIAYEIARTGFIEKHVKEICSVYKNRRDVMLGAMDSYFPPGVEWTHPQGGLFLWGTLPEQMNAADVLKAAIEQKVAFVPGTPFFPNGGGHNTMRLNFSYASEEKIMEGISRLGRVLFQKLGEPSPNR